MASNSNVNIPSGMGGLTRFKEEYESRFNLKPAHVVIFIFFIIGLRIALPYIFK